MGRHQTTLALTLLLALAVFPAHARAQDCSPPTLAGMVSGFNVGLSWSQSGTDDYTIEAGTRAGASDLASIDTASRRFTRTVAAGTYFLRIRLRGACAYSVSNELEIQVPCLQAAPTLAPAGAFLNGQRLVFGLPENTETTGYRLEVAPAPSEPDMWSFFTGFDTSFGFSWGGPGIYYARLRSTTACGGMLVSNEVPIPIR